MQHPVYVPELNREVDIQTIVNVIWDKIIEFDYDFRNSQTIELDIESIHFEIEVMKHPDYIRIVKVWMSTEEVEKFEEIEKIVTDELIEPLYATHKIDMEMLRQAEEIAQDRQF